MERRDYGYGPYGRGRGDVRRPVPGDGLEALPTKTLLQELFAQGQRLFREEVRLAKVEVKDEAQRLGKGAGFMGAGAGIAWIGAWCFVAFVVLALGTVIPLWASALIVSAVLLCVGAILGFAGKKKVERVDLVPPETARTLEEDKRWVSETMRAVRSKRHASA